jgi:predicted ribosome quality control (RQC) complex YloA/Tae2 family protein
MNLMKQQSLTSFDIYFVAAELENLLSGRTINKIIVGPRHVCFQVGGVFIIFDVIKGSPYLITPDICPPSRNWLTQISGARIGKVMQVLMDRVIVFELSTFNKLGKRKDFKLYFEFFKSGNILLTDSQDRIVSSFRKVENIGEKYATKKPLGFNVLELNEHKALSKADIDELKSLEISGYSEIMKDPDEAIAEFVRETMDKPQPHIIVDDSQNVVGFAVYGPPYINGLAGIPSKTFIEAITAYASAIKKERVRKTGYKKQIKKADNKLHTIEQELKTAKDYPKYRLYGELILANLGKLKKGQTVCELPSPYDNEAKVLTFELNPSRSPRQNAEDYFDKARKLEKSIPIIKKRLARQRAELGNLKTLDSLPEKQIGEEDDRSLRPERKQKRVPFRQFDLGNGWVIYAGKSARSNDELTFGFARKDDIWFHAWQAHGSHLILRPPRKGVIADKDVFLKAASLAAYYSKAKKSGKVPVIYTEVRYLRKVKKVPGKVIYTHEKELMVEPQSPEEILK